MGNQMTPADEQRVLALERPDPVLWKYYIIKAILTGPGIFVSLPLLFFRYYTLRYRFDAEGIHMKVGIIFRKEVNLTYARIQDIHLQSGIIQRWLGIANLEVQTASGSATAELTVEGFKEYELIRDFLYTRMRGYKSSQGATSSSPAGIASTVGGAGDAEVVSLLLGIRDELRQTRELLEAGKHKPPGTPSSHV